MFFKYTILLIILSAYSSNAYAYLDPGVGRIILQGIIASIAAASLTIKIYWQKIKDFFKKRKKTHYKRN